MRCGGYVKDCGDPPYLLDLNPIEHGRVLLKRHVTEDYPDLADTSGGVGAVKVGFGSLLGENTRGAI